jgi:hypothetical protein
MQSDFWGFFHDGTVAQIRGAIPGNVVVFIEIQYLRAMFPGNGEGFEVRLSDCTHIEYQEWEGEPVTSFEAIVSKEPEIVSVQSLAPLVLSCVSGTFKLAYNRAAVSTDTHQELSYAQLEAGTRAYWEAWQKKWKGTGGS